MRLRRPRSQASGRAMRSRNASAGRGAWRTGTQSRVRRTPTPGSGQGAGARVATARVGSSSLRVDGVVQRRLAWRPRGHDAASCPPQGSGLVTRLGQSRPGAAHNAPQAASWTAWCGQAGVQRCRGMRAGCDGSRDERKCGLSHFPFPRPFWSLTDDSGHPAHPASRDRRRDLKHDHGPDRSRTGPRPACPRSRAGDRPGHAGW